MNKIKDADFMTKFPPALKKDESMFALGQLIAEELHITANKTKENIIYANIDELSETWLDVLAYDLHVDWYDYDYPIEIKRKLLKDSVKVHQKLGTKYAVQSVLQNVYRTAKVEEWFEYGGKPYTFRVTVDIGNEGLNEGTSCEIIYKMQFYKNLRSHCEGVYHFLSVERAIVKAVALHEVGTKLKVKPLLKNKIRAAGQNDIRAATIYVETIKIKPMLQNEIRRDIEKRIAGKLQELNNIKIKSYTESVLSVGMKTSGNIRAYHRSKMEMTVGKE